METKTKMQIMTINSHLKKLFLKCYQFFYEIYKLKLNNNKTKKVFQTRQISPITTNSFKIRLKTKKGRNDE